MKIAVYPGSFDPFTLGHKDILLRSDDGSGGIATYFYLDGSTVLLACQANGMPLPKIRWTKNGQNVKQLSYLIL